MIPGWPYSMVVALEPGRTSWTLPLDAVRLGPADDVTEVSAAQLRDVVTRLIAAGQWEPGDPGILAVFDAGYDLTRLAWLLDGLPVDITGRLRSDRVMYFPAPPLPAQPATTGGRRPCHGHKLDFSVPGTWPGPAVTTLTQTIRLTSPDNPSSQGRRTTRACGTPPTRRDSRAARHDPDRETAPSQCLNPTQRRRERSRLASVAFMKKRCPPMRAPDSNISPSAVKPSEQDMSCSTVR